MNHVPASTMSPVRSQRPTERLSPRTLRFAEMVGAQTFVSESDCGHYMWRCDADAFNAAVREFLDER